jgi:atypical dual specificity phosphatase
LDACLKATILEAMSDTPIPDSYWLLEDRLLAGEYPGAYNEKEARRKIEAILKAGILSFIDLTEAVDPLKPYEPILQELAASMGLEVSYRRMPIRDMSIPTTELMDEILNTIETEIGAGRPVYFHCWGGIGRTGTVAGCWLVQQGYTCEDALKRIRELRAGTSDAGEESPQTDRQRAFVRGWPSSK